MYKSRRINFDRVINHGTNKEITIITIITRGELAIVPHCYTFSLSSRRQKIFVFGLLQRSCTERRNRSEDRVPTALSTGILRMPVCNGSPRSYRGERCESWRTFCLRETANLPRLEKKRTRPSPRLGKRWIGQPFPDTDSSGWKLRRDKRLLLRIAHLDAIKYVSLKLCLTRVSLTLRKKGRSDDYSFEKSGIFS